MKKKHIVFIVICLLTNSLIAQNFNVLILGHVKNENGQAIGDAHIYGSKYGKGVITNINGFFQMNVTFDESFIVVSHVSYREKKIQITNRKEFGDTIPLEIVLELNSNYLSSVDIVESKRWQVVKPERVWVYDYELLDNNETLLLLKDTSKYELRYLKSNNKVLDNISFKRDKPNKLIHDGLGNIFLDQRDSIFQTFVDERGIGFYEGIHKKDFDLMIKPVVAGNDKCIFFKTYYQNNQRLTYYYIDRDTKIKHELISIFNRESFLGTKGIEEELLALAGVNPMGDISWQALDQWKEFYQLKRYYDEIACLPVYSPLIQFGECVCVFDLINGLLSIFNAKSELIKEQAIFFHENKDVYSIVVDQIKGDFYSLWKKNGVVHIDKINMKNGTVAKTYVLKDYIFPEKVQFRNGQIYFLYSDYNFNKKLFKMPISHL